MPPRNPPTSRIELLQGTLDFIILQALRWGPCHGYGIVQLIRSQSANVLQVETGSLYPALQRLLKDGLVDAEWGVSATNRRVRTYRITRAGAKHLGIEVSRFERMLEGITLVLALGAQT